MAQPKSSVYGRQGRPDKIMVGAAASVFTPTVQLLHDLETPKTQKMVCCAIKQMAQTSAIKLLHVSSKSVGGIETVSRTLSVFLH